MYPVVYDTQAASGASSMGWAPYDGEDPSSLHRHQMQVGAWGSMSPVEGSIPLWDVRSEYTTPSPSVESIDLWGSQSSAAWQHNGHDFGSQFGGVSWAGIGVSYGVSQRNDVPETTMLRHFSTPEYAPQPFQQRYEGWTPSVHSQQDFAWEHCIAGPSTAPLLPALEHTPIPTSDDEHAQCELHKVRKELLAKKPYGDGAFRRPLELRYADTMLYKLAQPSGWESRVTNHRGAIPVAELERMKAQVDADARYMLGRMSAESDEADDVADLQAAVLARLDHEIARRTSQQPPPPPQEPAEIELRRMRRKIYDIDWVSCVWCGRKRLARGDDWYIAERHLKTTCSMFLALQRHGLVAKWRRLHEGEVHAHDRYQLQTKSACDMPPAPAQSSQPVRRRKRPSTAAKQRKAARESAARKRRV